jgi:predicted nucleic acid-binding Zn ribbon protein
MTNDESPDTGNEIAPPDHLAGLTGMDLVRRTLDEARGAARSQGKDVGRGRGAPAPRRIAGRRRRWSGPGPDARDPQTLAAATRDLARTRGWSLRVAQGTVFGQWQTVVGEHIAAHATPTALREGVLSVSAETTAWATQLRMVQAQLLAKIAAAVGDGVVTSLKIVGPVAPSWRKGHYHIAGRGPRDTYG